MINVMGQPNSSEDKVQIFLHNGCYVATCVSASRCSEQEKDEMSSLKRSLFNENSRRNQ